MPDPAQDAQWKDKYGQLIGEIEHKKEQCSALKALMRRSVSGVAIAASHLDTRLDNPLKAIRGAVGGKLDSRCLKDGLENLSETLDSLVPGLDPPGAVALLVAPPNRSIRNS